MPKANRKSPTEKETARQESRRFEIGGVLMIAVGLFALTAIARFDVGIAGYWTHTILEYLFGLGAFIPALALIFLGARYVYRPRAMAVKTRDTAWGIYFVLGLSRCIGGTCRPARKSSRLGFHNPAARLAARVCCVCARFSVRRA